MESISLQCEKAGIAVSTYYRRRGNGMNHEEALNTPKGEIKGKTLAERCKDAGIATRTYYCRIASGMTPEEALSKPARAERDYGDVTLASLCESAGITRGQYYGRLRMGKTHEEALAMGNKPVRKTIARCNDRTKLMLQLKKAGISYSTYRARIRKGMTHDEALAAPYQQHRKWNSTSAEETALTVELNRIDGMDGSAFEDWCADLLVKLGFSDVRHVSGSGDYGADILANKDGESYVFRCKRFAGYLGNKPVQEAFTAISYYNAQHGGLITNSELTKRAAVLAETVGIEVWDREVLETTLPQRRTSHHAFISAAVRTLR